jgi:non-specific serine/threonine protein kinase/serine/threonine-protein kinase
MFEVHDSISQLPGATAPRKLIIQRAQEYLDSLAQESKSDPTLLRELAAAYVRLAIVQGNPNDANVGDTPKALQNNRKAVELLEAGLSLDSSNRDMRRELAECNLNLATIQATLGDKSGDKQALEKAVRILEDLATSQPEDLKAEAVLGDTYGDMGLSFNRENDLAQGLAYNEKALAIFERLARGDPKNDQYQTRLASSHKRVASVLMIQNHLDAALEHERAALAIDEEQLAMHPDNARARYSITFTYSDTGFILGRQGHFDAAIESYSKALAIRAALAAADPADIRARQGLTNTYYSIGINLESKGDFPAALDFWKKALAIRETLSRADPANESLRSSIANTQSSIGGLYTEMAFKGGTPPTEVLQSCGESETWIRRALPSWLDRKAKGKLFGDEVRAFAQIYENLEKCDRAIARLKRTAKSSP